MGSSSLPGTRRERQLAAAPSCAQALCQTPPSAQGWKQCPQATGHSAACTNALQPVQGHLRLSHVHCCLDPAICRLLPLQVVCNRLGCFGAKSNSSAAKACLHPQLQVSSDLSKKRLLQVLGLQRAEGTGKHSQDPCTLL